MKFNLITLLTVILFLSVNQSDAQTAPKKTASGAAKKTVAVKKTVAAKVSAAEITEAKGLLAKSDCLACHKVDMKIVGPAYIDVAKKYPATEASYTLLTNKIINGGSGVWGQVAMAPHPSLPAADAKKMVRYILSLK